MISRQIEVFEYTARVKVAQLTHEAQNVIAETQNTIEHCSFIIADVCQHGRSNSEQL